MEKKNNSGMLVGILIGIIIMLLVVGGLFATGTIGFKSTISTDKKEKTNDSNVINSNEQVNNNSSEKVDNIERKLETSPFDSDKLEAIISNNVTVPISEIVIKEYEETQNGEYYYLKLLSNGRINIVKNKDSNHYTDFISNISNVIDVANLPMRGTENSMYYFLLSNGDVYYYILQDLSKGKKEATKVNDVSEVKRIINTTIYVKANQPPTFAIVAITNDEYKVIASE